ncbi:hypothetical protein BDY19DRAFT_932298 [Irpex rosettiformis]|uniref:Uncharacterized protein n=1 Tax=Irpex rosettiformis TaxID=378272 RepID=A0ACB8UCL1_9APHY|nr:hypothetical protein BDY19DRAFT_932298 [Irpex rosettiformis]
MSYKVGIVNELQEYSYSTGVTIRQERSTRICVEGRDCYTQDASSRERSMRKNSWRSQRLKESAGRRTVKPAGKGVVCLRWCFARHAELERGFIDEHISMFFVLESQWCDVSVILSLRPASFRFARLCNGLGLVSFARDLVYLPSLLLRVVLNGIPTTTTQDGPRGQSPDVDNIGIYKDCQRHRSQGCWSWEFGRRHRRDNSLSDELDKLKRQAQGRPREVCKVKSGDRMVKMVDVEER